MLQAYKAPNQHGVQPHDRIRRAVRRNISRPLPPYDRLRVRCPRPRLRRSRRNRGSSSGGRGSGSGPARQRGRLGAGDRPREVALRAEVGGAPAGEGAEGAAHFAAEDLVGLLPPGLGREHVCVCCRVCVLEVRGDGFLHGRAETQSLCVLNQHDEAHIALGDSTCCCRARGGWRESCGCSDCQARPRAGYLSGMGCMHDR
ncbi:hypothetical protein GY45DRAFT_1014515 [Cubamyces sp. BRFM 1775]|nr:hypothetical protein GY45DRAFT_1014515 [Cubamyces sp. BRFM 1775]